MSELTRVEIAAIWLYHEEYAAQKLSAKEFYAQLLPYKQRTIDTMIEEIVRAKP